MISWMAFVVLTAALMLALLWALRAGRSGGSNDSSVAALAVYKDQLAEIDRDIERGLIATSEADAARNEISRRILAADQGASEIVASAASPALHTMARVFVLAVIPVIALGLYFLQGRPDLPGVPHAGRMANAVASNDFPALVAQVEEHLASNPDDVQGWIVLAPAYRRLERYADAASAYAEIIRLKGATSDLLSDFGEALLLANQGLVGADARKAFDQALALDETNSRARFYTALALRQEGKFDAALAMWREMLASAPANAPWRRTVERQIVGIESERAAAPALDEEKLAAARDMPATDQQAMIKAMVDRLDARLASDGGDIEGWLRLARARSVLGESDAARAALAKAESQFQGDAAALERIASLRKALQLD